MPRRKINLIFVWFSVILCLQFTFGFIALGAQFELKNPINIRDEVNDITLLENPERITDNILIIFVDGMRYDKMLEANTPNIDRLMNNGTTFSNFRSVFPSYSLVNYAAFSTGSTPNMTGVYANAHTKELAMETLYSVIDSTDLNKSIITGSNAWLRYLGKDSDIEIKVKEEGSHTLLEGEKVLEAVSNELAVNFSNIQFIGFKDVDAAGHDYGANSEIYLETIENIDNHIGGILDIYETQNQLTNTTIVLFSDHGHADIGGHGDNTENQTHASLILAGNGITNWNTVSDERVSMNFVTPTLLSMLGLPLAPTMNGLILHDLIDTTNQTEALYALQETSIILQQFNKTIYQINSLTNKIKGNYITSYQNFNEMHEDAEAEFLGGNYSGSFDLARTSNFNTRFWLRSLIDRYEYSTRFTRYMVIIGVIAIAGLVLFYLSRRNILEYNFNNIFEKRNLVSEITSAVLTIGIAIGIFAIFSFDFSATSFNSVQQTLPPVLTAYFVGIAIVGFLPWLIIWLFKKNETKEQIRFKDLKNNFKEVMIGSIFFLSLPIFGYFLFVIASYGPWPGAFLPPLADSYAYMIIGILGGIIYLIPLVIIGIDFIKKRKKKTIVETI